MTIPSNTNNMEKILQTLDAEIEATTGDSYTRTLYLAHTAVKVTTDGHATKTGTVSATRTYPSLSEVNFVTDSDAAKIFDGPWMQAPLSPP